MDAPNPYIDLSLTESHTDNILSTCLKGPINNSGIVWSSKNLLYSK